MARLLAVALVLCLTSLAGAAMWFTADDADVSEITLLPGDIFTLGVVSNLGGSSGSGIFYIDIPKSQRPFYGITGMQMLAAAGNKAAVIGPYSWETWDEYEFRISSTTQQNSPGTQLEGIFQCKGPGDVMILLSYADGTLIDKLIVHQLIPEPVTIAMLGLGGLALLGRRKR